MKKSLFMLSAAALTLASCSQEEVLNVATGGRDANAIAFQAHAGKSTRAAEINTANLTEFNVFGYHGDVDDLRGLYSDNGGSLSASDLMTDYFGKAVKFSITEEMYDGDNGIGQLFTSEQPYYWPSDFSPLTFMAYAPAELAMTANGYGEMHLDGFTVKDNIEEQVDLITDCTPGRRDNDMEEEYPVMPFWFNHALAKVYVSSAFCEDERYTYQVAGVKLGRVYKKGDYIFNKIDNIELSEQQADAPLADHQIISDDDHLYHYWKADEASRGDFTVIFDTPVTIGTSATPIMNGGYNEEAGTLDGKGCFLMIPQQLDCTPEKEYDADENVRKYKLDDDAAYIALLIRITHDMGEGNADRVVYPYAKGVDQISETIDGVKYAWAAFPVGSLWRAGRYTNYTVDFSKGAGFVAPGSEGVDIVEVWGEDPVHKNLDYSPILGGEIRFIEEVFDWNSGTGNTVDQINGEGVVDEEAADDPFFEP